MTDYLHEIRVFENYELLAFEAGHVVVTTKVVPQSLNYSGHAHGGYLFTLCDQVSGLVARSLGSHAVTLQSSINYLKAGQLEDCLTIKGRCLHNGKSTKIVETTITNQAGKLIVKATFTMFVTDEDKKA